VLGESMRVFGDFVRFTFVFNPGGAFGINIGNFWIYTFISVIAVIIVITYFIRVSNSEKIAKICLAFVVGGAVGNLVDRIIYGQVTDFIDVNILDIVISPFSLFGLNFTGYQLDRWYIFNFADAAITLGLIGFIIYLLVTDKSGHQIIGRKETPDGNPNTKTDGAGE
jgi:signal peptidase II